MNQPRFECRIVRQTPGTDTAEFNAVCRSKRNLPTQTDLNAALLPYFTQQLGSAHEWSGVWNGPMSP